MAENVGIDVFWHLLFAICNREPSNLSGKPQNVPQYWPTGAGSLSCK